MSKFIKTEFKKILWDAVDETHVDATIKVEATIHCNEVFVDWINWGPVCISAEEERELKQEAAERISQAYIGRGLR